MRRLGSTFLDKLLLSAAEGILVLDDRHKITVCNPAACRILGLEEARILGSTPDELEGVYIHEDGSVFPPSQYPAEIALRTGRPCHGVTMGLQRNASGERSWITINADILPGKNKDTTRVLVVFNDITAHIETKIRLREVLRAREGLFHELERSEASMRGLLQVMPSPVWIKDVNGVYLSCNGELERFFNIPGKEIIGRTDYDITSREDAALFEASDRTVVANGERIHIEHWVAYASDQRRAFMSIIKLPIRDATGKITGILGIAHDMTEKKRAEDQLNGLMAYKDAILANAPIGLSVFSIDRICLEANPSFCEIFDYTATELVGKSSRLLFRDDAGFEELALKIWPVVLQGGTYTADLPMRRRDNVEIWVRTVIHLIDIKAPTLGVIVIVTDVTAQKALELDLQRSNAELQKRTEQLQAVARTDPLTEIANRRAFIEAAEAEFLRFKRFNAATSVLMIDIDHFKTINDTFGHEVGDHALVALASTLKSLARATDLPARFGGEEFVVLLNGTSSEGASEVAERIRQEIAALSISAGKQHFSMTVSIGVASFGSSDGSWSQAIARADAAMYRAKSQGRNQVVVDAGPQGNKV